MKMIKNILGRVFAFWALIVFVVTMLLIYIPFLITGLWKEPRRTVLFIQLSRTWMKVFFTLSGVRRIFKGKEHFKKGENYIVVCNHNTFMDVPLSSPGIPGGNKTIAKMEMAKIPLFGIMYQRGSVLVDRKSEESRKSSFTRMKEVLAMGLHMCIYPEGTRNKTNEPLQRFHDGAFKLAKDSGHAVLPAVIFYTKIVLPLHKTFYFWPHKVEMHFLKPISPEGLTVDQLKEKVFITMRDYYVSGK
ncbi:MAG TPA: lysophospholipid acyltransferase family protein [Chitinophagaceae bacterium]